MRCFCRLGLCQDVGVTSQAPDKRLNQKQDKESLHKRMYALFQVEGKQFAKEMEAWLQNYATKLNLEGFTNCEWAAGNGVVEGINTIYIVYWPEELDRPETIDDWLETTNASQEVHADPASQDTLTSAAGSPSVP